MSNEIPEHVYDDLSREQLDREFDNIRRIQFEVSLRTGKRSDWIARQQNRDAPEGHKWIGWGFVVGRECLFIPHADAMHDPKDTALIDELATQVLGYPPDSIKHLEAQKEDIEQGIERSMKELEHIESRIRSLKIQRDKLNAQLKELRNE